MSNNNKQSARHAPQDFPSDLPALPGSQSVPKMNGVTVRTVGGGAAPVETEEQRNARTTNLQEGAGRKGKFTVRTF